MDACKVCFKCNIEKSLEDYYAHSAMADGRLNKCKVCTKSDTIKNRADKIDYYKDYDKKRANLKHRVAARKAYTQTEQGRLAGNRGKLNYSLRNPKKRKATYMVGNAIRDGRLIRMPCEICGNKAQAHHDDYNKPLEVRWLCPKHHSEWHKNNEPLNPN